MLSILLSIISATIASLATWYIVKSYYSKHYISTETYSALQQQYTQLYTSEAVLKGLFIDTQHARDAAEARVESVLLKVEELGARGATAQANYEGTLQNYEKLSVQHSDLQGQLATSQSTIVQLRSLNATLQASVESKESLLAEQRVFVEKMKSEMEREFRLIASSTVDMSAKTLGEQQESKLTDLLKPFREQIQTFQEAVGKHFVEEGKEKVSLQKEIELLARSSQVLSKQATDLTDALRGSTKQQGDWGEGILERILEHCGLKEGVDYSVQASEKATDGKAFRPDVVLHMVGGRNLVIDSKVSLNAYWDMCAAPDATSRETFFPAICSALRKHIDELHHRPYSEVAGTPGYLIMFVPVEAAYITALQHDGNLWQYAYDKGVLLISPTNLIPFMRLVSSLWDRDKKYKNAESIARNAGLLYDKLALFVKKYEKVGNALRSAQTSYDESFGQLATGRGNLIAKAEELRSLKVSAKQQLPQSLVESAMLTSGVLLQDIDTEVEQ
jgi:DNA recombination protein RmuC